MLQSLPAALRAKPDSCAEALPPGAGGTLTLGGWVREPVELTREDLLALPVRALAGFTVSCTFGGDHGAERALRGVAVRELMSMVEPAFDRGSDFKRAVLVAHARDGYRVLFSWAEVFNTVVGEGLHVAFDHPEAPLDDRSGPFALVSLHDQVTGPRFARGVVALDVVRVW